MQFLDAQKLQYGEMALLELYLVVAVHNLGLLVVVFSSVVVLSSVVAVMMVLGRRLIGTQEAQQQRTSDN